MMMMVPSYKGRQERAETPKGSGLWLFFPLDLLAREARRLRGEDYDDDGALLQRQARAG